VEISHYGASRVERVKEIPEDLREICVLGFQPDDQGGEAVLIVSVVDGKSALGQEFKKPHAFCQGAFLTEKYELQIVFPTPLNVYEVHFMKLFLRMIYHRTYTFTAAHSVRALSTEVACPRVS
jgi:hypothetical protein